MVSSQTATIAAHVQAANVQRFSEARFANRILAQVYVIQKRSDFLAGFIVESAGRARWSARMSSIPHSRSLQERVIVPLLP